MLNVYDYYRYYIVGDVVFNKLRSEYYKIVTKGTIYEQLKEKTTDELLAIMTEKFCVKEKSVTSFDFAINKKVFLEYILDFGAELKFFEGYPIDDFRRKVHNNEGDKYYSILLKNSNYYRYSVVYFVGNIAYGISYVFE
jgi:hypothetical protein